MHSGQTASRKVPDHVVLAADDPPPGPAVPDADLRRLQRQPGQERDGRPGHFQARRGGAGLAALAGALFIAPYALLSATAGQLADRFDKSRLIQATRRPRSC